MTLLAMSTLLAGVTDDDVDYKDHDYHHHISRLGGSVSGGRTLLWALTTLIAGVSLVTKLLASARRS